MLPALIQSTRNAPLLVGAFFMFLCLSACKEKSKTATWVTSEPEKTVVVESPAEKPEGKVDEGGTTESTEGEAITADSPTEGEIRFLSYNLKNYLTMRRGREYLPKPEEEKSAVVALIARQNPDVLGLCEIGSLADLEELQNRLKNAGVDLPHSEHTGGRDKTRRLALLSRYPIVNTNSQTDLSYEMNGDTWVISRGILDATVKVENGSELRFLGVHLKSKREIDEADQELIRQNEARLLRNHMNDILEENPEVNLLAYGDFNDTIGSKTLSIVRGRRNSAKHMPDFYFKDSRGDLWTHFWDYQDVYSRFDYVLFSDPLRSRLVGNKSYIVDDEAWLRASDHRALMLVLAP